MFDTVALASVTAISVTLSKPFAMKVRSRVACRYTTPCICADTPSKAGREVTR